MFISSSSPFGRGAEVGNGRAGTDPVSAPGANWHFARLEAAMRSFGSSWSRNRRCSREARSPAGRTPASGRIARRFPNNEEQLEKVHTCGNVSRQPRPDGYLCALFSRKQRQERNTFTAEVQPSSCRGFLEMQFPQPRPRPSLGAGSLPTGQSGLAAYRRAGHPWRLQRKPPRHITIHLHCNDYKAAPKSIAI